MVSLVNTTKEEPLTRITTVYLDFKLSISEGNHIIDSMSPCEGCNERVCCIHKQQVFVFISALFMWNQKEIKYWKDLLIL